MLTLITLDIIDYKWIQITLDKDNKTRAVKLLKSINYLHGIQSSSNSVAHWIFAIEYFKIALNFPIIIELFQSNVNEKLKRVKQIVFWTNFYYYAQLLLWLILIFSIDIEAKTDYALIFDVQSKVMSAGLLGYSIISLKRNINKVKRPDFFARERLMHIHTILFIAYVCFYIIECSLNLKYAHYYLHESPPNYLMSCRYIIAATVFTELAQITNILILVLLIYMSLKFSEPLTNYWQSFMLVF